MIINNKIKKSITIICKPIPLAIIVRTMWKVRRLADTLRKVYGNKYLRIYPQKLTFKRLKEIKAKNLILANSLQQHVISTYNTFISLPSSNTSINPIVPSLASQELSKILTKKYE
jgi:hypothetical protein